MEDRLKLKNYYSTKEFRENFIYDGNDLGVECNEKKTSFRLWSPGAEYVLLNLYNAGDGGEAYRQIQMKKKIRVFGAGIVIKNFTVYTMII